MIFTAINVQNIPEYWMIEDIEDNISRKDRELADLYVDMIAVVRQYDRVINLFEKLQLNGDNNNGT